MRRAGWDWSFSLMDYNSLWRTRRRLFHQYFGANAATDYVSFQRKRVGDCLQRLKKCPAEYQESIKL